MSKPVIIFSFWGRRANIEVQLPLIQRILADNPNVEFHAWNFARNDADRAYIKTIHGPGITVWNGEGDGYASPTPTEADAQVRQFGANEHNAAYTHYARDEFADHLFVKLDDDIVFLETGRFTTFIAAIETHPDAVIVADTINNCCSTRTHPKLWDDFLRLNIPVDQVFKSREYAAMAHRYFFFNTTNILGADPVLVPTEDWVEINAVGYSHQVLQHCVRTIGTPHPEWLAGRDMRRRQVRHGRRIAWEYPWGQMFGDEGTFQVLPRYILKGFTAAHLSFGAQGNQLDQWRDTYRQIGTRYLRQPQRWSPPAGAIALSDEVSCGKRDQGLEYHHCGVTTLDAR
jgi:hypothetical protein